MYNVTINGKQFEAKYRSTPGNPGYIDIIFVPLGKRNAKYVARSIGERVTRYKGGGFGPFAGPAQETKMFNIKGWGEVEWIGLDEYQHVAERFEANKK